jgi:hypothetical protein
MILQLPVISSAIHPLYNDSGGDKKQAIILPWMSEVVSLQLLDVPCFRHLLYDDIGRDVKAGNDILYCTIES